MAPKSFITCLSEYRKAKGMKGGKAPKKGTPEYEAVKKMMGPSVKKEKDEPKK
jgi:hypothetical protein